MQSCRNRAHPWFFTHSNLKKEVTLWGFSSFPPEEFDPLDLQISNLPHQCSHRGLKFSVPMVPTLSCCEFFSSPVPGPRGSAQALTRSSCTTGASRAENSRELSTVCHEIPGVALLLLRVNLPSSSKWTNSWMILMQMEKNSHSNQARVFHADQHPVLLFFSNCNSRTLEFAICFMLCWPA